jgi:hypothetical protein
MSDIKDNMIILSEFGYGKIFNFEDFINDYHYYKVSNNLSLILVFDRSNLLNDSNIINIEFIYSIFNKINNNENYLNQITIILPSKYRIIYSIISSFSNIKFKTLSTYSIDISNQRQIISYSNSCIEHLLIKYEYISAINSISNETLKNCEIEEFLKSLLYQYHPILSVNYENNQSTSQNRNCNLKKSFVCIYYFSKKNEDKDILVAAGILEDGQIFIYCKDPFDTLNNSQINKDDKLVLLESCIYSCINILVSIEPIVRTSLFFTSNQGDEIAEMTIQKILIAQKYPYINRIDTDILKINNYTYNINYTLDKEINQTNLFVLAGQSNMSGRGNEDDMYNPYLIKSQRFGSPNCSESIKISERYCQSKNSSIDKEINNSNGKLIYFDPISSWSKM